MTFLAELRAKTHPFFTAATNILFPPKCASCGEPNDAAHSLCVNCFAQLQLISAPLCQACGEPFAYDMGDQAVCASCLQEPPLYEVARAAMHYDDASRHLVTRLKYADQQQLVPILSRQLWRAGAALCEQSDWLIPVPMHPKRLRARMFNQSALLAYGLAEHCALPVMADGLLRTENTPPQASLTRQERLENVRRAFRVNHKRAALLRRARVLLIDDVMTTGATVNACCKMLLGAGVQSVSVLTVARTVKH